MKNDEKEIPVSRPNCKGTGWIETAGATMKPCKNCPFLKTSGVRGLRAGRCREIVDDVLSDRYFPCHKHVYEGASNPVCRGAMTFAYKLIGDRAFDIQSIRMAERFNMWTVPTPEDANKIFDSLAEMEAAQ